MNCMQILKFWIQLTVISNHIIRIQNTTDLIYVECGVRSKQIKSVIETLKWSTCASPSHNEAGSPREWQRASEGHDFLQKDLTFAPGPRPPSSFYVPCHSLQFPGLLRRGYSCIALQLQSWKLSAAPDEIIWMKRFPSLDNGLSCCFRRSHQQKSGTLKGFCQCLVLPNR